VELVGESVFPWVLFLELERRIAMLWTIAVLLMLLWAVGMVSSYTIGGFIHILLLLAVISIAIQLIGGRRVV
jgi:hypothetical protein